MEKEDQIECNVLMMLKDSDNKVSWVGVMKSQLLEEVWIKM